MAKIWRCDNCPYEQLSPLAFTVKQITDETDDDDTPVTLTLHLCSAGCFATYAMSLEIEHPDQNEP